MRTPLVAIVVAAALTGGIWSLLPPAPARVPASAVPEPVRGVIHVHTRRSDGSGTPDQIAAAAARAGLRFVIFTDHGDGTRTPEPPAYRHGVLCLDAVEISTTGGHVVALGLSGRTPYRLGGEARDVVEDVARLGGMSIAAHPASRKPELQWRDWDVPFDGLEWVNADSEWRDEPLSSLAAAILTYPFRKAETVASVFDRPVDVLGRWDDLARRRLVVAVGAADAHATIGIGRDNPYGDRSPLAMPGYEQLFRAFSIALPHVVLTGTAAVDAEAIVRELRRGRAYTSIDAIAAPARLSFAASSAAGRAGPGETLHAGTPITFEAFAGGLEGSTIELLRDGKVVARGTGALRLESSDSAPGAYRVEVHVPGAPGDPPVPWIVSNPVYVGAYPRGSAMPAPAPVRERLVQFTGTPAAGQWSIEHNPESDGEIDSVRSLEGSELLWRFALGGSDVRGGYVALALRAGPSIADYDRLLFRARASAPMRVWVQLRQHKGARASSWRRSVYVDETMRDVSIPFSDMNPMDGQPRISGTPPVIDDILFVIDPTHTPLGVSGRVWLDDVAYGR